MTKRPGVAPVEENGEEALSTNVEPGPLMQAELADNHRSGFAALVGKPNVGKSTLLNAWMNLNLAPVSPKPQTTRSRLLGILTRPDAQVIFVDTPGIHRPRTKLGAYMVETAKRAIPDADVVIFLVDASEAPREADREVAQLLGTLEGIPTILALNKYDLVTPAQRQGRYEEYESLGAFEETMFVSALDGHNRDLLLERAIALLPLGPRYYPEDQISDQQERFIVADLIREHVLRCLEQEVPHAVAVLVQEYDERPNGLVHISATIYTERDSQKGIVIGRKGSMLKRIGRQARISLEAFLGQRVYLELWVKVRKDWRRNERFLRELGYSLRGS